MDAEAVIWLLVMLVWFASGVIRQIRGMGKGSQPSDASPTGDAAPVPRQAPAPSPPSSRSPSPSQRQARRGDDPLQELFRQLGVEVVPEEQPVPSEHRPTASEYRPTASEQRPTASEQRPTASEHRRTASEVRVTASEHRPTLSEHLPTLSEHLPGDVQAPLKRVPPAASRRRRNHLLRAIRRDLYGSRRSLGKAWLMKEILGPAPGLEPPGQRF